MANLWPLLVITAVGAVLIAALRMGPRVFPGSRHAGRAFWCPFRERDVAVQFQETVWDAALRDVERCSAFSPPTAIGCDKKCLHLARLPARRDREARSL